MFNGIIVIHKEAGFTSHDVVAKMRGICGQKKIGHTGTLDPAATGVLPVCLGSGTRLCDMLADREKEYIAELLLGVETDTQDTSGTVLKKSDVTVSEKEVREACLSFIGDYEQVPPMYSALKVNGKKLYELARAGQEIERKARPVKILELEILEICLPVVKMRVVCSKGTYIRTLCADIGERLGCGGTMKNLVRTRVGGFALDHSFTLRQLQEFKEKGALNEVVIPVDFCFRDCPEIHVEATYRRLLDNGNPIFPAQTLEKKIYSHNEWIRVYQPTGEFAGIYSYEEHKQYYKPVKMFFEKE